MNFTKAQRKLVTLESGLRILSKNKKILKSIEEGDASLNIVVTDHGSGSSPINLNGAQEVIQPLLEEKVDKIESDLRSIKESLIDFLQELEI